VLPLLTKSAIGAPQQEGKLVLSPEFLAQYAIGPMLGCGAMGMVVRAEQRSVGRPVAVKFLKLRDPVQLERFLREGRVMARISHPHVTKVFDSGEIDGHPYLVTELLEGGTLKEVVGAGALPWRVALPIAVALLEGLQACHEAGIVHRDLKPENILFEKAGKSRPASPKISDLGLASDEVDAKALTATGTLLGTPLYMAPEQLRDGRTGVRSDLWSMAAVIFEMLAGRAPVVAPSLAELVLAHDRPVARVETFAADVPRGLADAIARALDVDDEKRPASAAELAALVREAVGPAAPVRSRSGRVVAARMSSASVPVVTAAPRWTGKHLAALFVGLGVAGGLALGLVSRRAAPPPPALVAAVAVASVAAPPSLWVDPEPGEYAALERPGSGPLVAGAFSPDRRLVATLAADGTACVWDVATRRPLKVGAFPRAHLSRLAFSVRGDRLALASDSSIYRWMWKDSGAASRLAVAGGADGLAWLRGDRLAFARPAGLWVVEPAGDGPPRRLADGLSRLRCFAGSPDGGMLAAGLDDGTLLLINPDGGVRRVNAHGVRDASSLAEQFESPTAGKVLSVAFSPEGTQLVTGGSEGHARIWDARTGRAIDGYTTNGAPVYAVAIKSGGREILIAEGRPDDPYVAYWEPQTLNPGHLAIGEGTIDALGYGPAGGDVLLVMREGVRRVPAEARRSNLSATSAGYTSMFGFSVPARTEPPPPRTPR